MIAGHTIVSVRDLAKGHAYDSCNPPAYMPVLPLSGDDMITFKAKKGDPETQHASSITLTLRASGTEPKIKYYLEGSGSDITATSILLQQVLLELKTNWIEVEKNGLLSGSGEK